MKPLHHGHGRESSGGAGCACPSGFRPLMRASGLTLLAFMLLGTPVLAQPSSDLFAAAGQAYDAGRFGDAEKLYRQLLERGDTAPELLFNLGNALFKQARYGEAVLAYRRAWYFRPRDADVRANLRLAQQETTAAETDLPAWKRLLLYVSAEEWRHSAAAAYWLAALAATAYLVAGRRWAWLRRLAVVTALLALVSAGGWTVWNRLAQRPEIVVIQGPQQALYAPLEGATPHFSLPAGSIARVRERSGSWLEVQSGDRTGWIPAPSSIEVLSAEWPSLPSS